MEVDCSRVSEGPQIARPSSVSCQFSSILWSSASPATREPKLLGYDHPLQHSNDQPPSSLASIRFVSPHPRSARSTRFPHLDQEQRTSQPDQAGRFRLLQSAPCKRDGHDCCIRWQTARPYCRILESLRYHSHSPQLPLARVANR